MADTEPRLCSFCDQDAKHTCGRCGRAYCDAHGRDLCRDCRAPDSALPTTAAFRGSLIALGVAAAIGLWALIAPPTLPGEHRLAKSGAQNPAAVQPVKGTGSGRSAVPTPNSAAAASPTPPPVRSYTVQLNDTLSGIADSFGTTVAAIQAANPGVAQVNLKAGQELLIPSSGTPQPSATPTAAPSATAGPTASPTATAGASPAPSATAGPSPTPAASPVPSATPGP
jgi:LysM repeat protein